MQNPTLRQNRSKTSSSESTTKSNSLERALVGIINIRDNPSAENDVRCLAKRTAEAFFALAETNARPGNATPETPARPQLWAAVEAAIVKELNTNRFHDVIENSFIEEAWDKAELKECIDEVVQDVIGQNTMPLREMIAHKLCNRLGSDDFLDEVKDYVEDEYDDYDPPAVKEVLDSMVKDITAWILEYGRRI